MHQFVNLWKVAETQDAVDYAYGIERESSGLVQLDKNSGAVRVLRHALDFCPVNSQSELLNLTCQRLKEAADKQDFPNNLYMA